MHHKKKVIDERAALSKLVVGGGGGIDDGLLRIFLHLLDVKEKNEGGGYRRERNFVYSKSEEESREEGRR